MHICEWCAKPYAPNKSNQRFCAQPCYTKWYERENRADITARHNEYERKRRADKREPRACLQCNAEFLPDNNARRFCTDACHQRYYYANNREAVRGWRRKYYLKVARETPWKAAIDAAKARARALGRAYELDLEWAQATWTGRCSVTGIEFVKIDDKANPFSPSIDRIDSSIGYTKENSRFVIWAVNAFKRDWPEEIMMRVARALIEYNPQ